MQELKTATVTIGITILIVGAFITYLYYQNLPPPSVTKQIKRHLKTHPPKDVLSPIPFVMETEQQIIDIHPTKHKEVIYLTKTGLEDPNSKFIIITKMSPHYLTRNHLRYVVIIYQRSDKPDKTYSAVAIETSFIPTLDIEEIHLYHPQPY